MGGTDEPTPESGQQEVTHHRAARGGQAQGDADGLSRERSPPGNAAAG
jgi:hypothetical protein